MTVPEISLIRKPPEASLCPRRRQRDKTVLALSNLIQTDSSPVLGRLTRRAVKAQERLRLKYLHGDGPLSFR